VKNRVRVGICIVGILALWVIDVAYSTAIVSNGFWDLTGQQAFHLSLWTALVAFIFLMFWE